LKVLWQTPVIVCPWSIGVKEWELNYAEAEYAIPILYFEVEVELETEFRTMRLALVQWLHVFDWNKGGDE
jgi:hypothetical protein